MDMKEIESHLKTLSHDELLTVLDRATGRTTREVDELVYKFFTAPYGEWIAVVDHYDGRVADDMLFNKFMRRMEIEHPSAEVEYRKNVNPIVVRRKNKTYHELAVEEFKRRAAVEQE
jgi:hypothetical protein